MTTYKNEPLPLDMEEVIKYVYSQKTFAVIMTGSEQDADDLLQNTLLNVLTDSSFKSIIHYKAIIQRKMWQLHFKEQAKIARRRQSMNIYYRPYVYESNRAESAIDLKITMAKIKSMQVSQLHKERLLAKLSGYAASDFGIPNFTLNKSIYLIRGKL